VGNVRMAKALILWLILLALALVLVVTISVRGRQSKTPLIRAAESSASTHEKEADGSSAGVEFPPGWSFVEIEPGSFTLGSPVSEAGRRDDEVQHSVTLTHGFWLGKYEVTQQQYKELMGTNPSLFPGPKRPVEQVSWDDTQEFLKMLNARERAAGRLPLGWVYRLPTEAEWEYAARAGTTTAYSFDNDAGTLGEYAWYGDNSGDQTHEVGLKDPNPWGLCDMYGNVWEWCVDWYGVYPRGDAIDTTGPTTGWGRVIRGGGWYDVPRYCRSAVRFGVRPDLCYEGRGFRVLAAQAAGQ
jgi:formylglycine-generating enzyme required for sulfatase activity